MNDVDIEVDAGQSVSPNELQHRLKGPMEILSSTFRFSLPKKPIVDVEMGITEAINSTVKADEEVSTANSNVDTPEHRKKRSRDTDTSVSNLPITTETLTEESDRVQVATNSLLPQINPLAPYASLRQTATTCKDKRLSL